MSRFLRRLWARIFAVESWLFERTEGHCAVCDNATRLGLVSGVWAICYECYIDYKAGLIQQEPKWPSPTPCSSRWPRAAALQSATSENGTHRRSP